MMVVCYEEDYLQKHMYIKMDAKTTKFVILAIF